MPKIDVTQAILALDGKPLRTQMEGVELCTECTKKLNDTREDFTLRMACTRSLTAMTQATQKLSGEEKFKRGQLAHRIHNEDEPHLSAEEITLLKAAIGEVEIVVVVLGTFPILDPPGDS